MSVIRRFLVVVAGARPAPNANRRRPPLPAYGGLRPACYLPQRPDLRAEVARRLLRRGLATLVEIACVGAFLAAVLIWAAIGAGA